jgi:Flp pilus assembly protein TadD
VRALGCPILEGALSLSLLLLVAGCAGEQVERDRAAVEKESSAEVLFRSGEAAARMGDMTRAEQYLVAAMRAGGDGKRIVKQLLIVCAADRRYPVAIDYAEQYLRRHPNDTEVLFAAGSLHAATGSLEPARVMLGRVVSERPEWPEPHYVLATVLREWGSPELADQHDLAYLRLSPEGPMAETARARLRRVIP